MNLLNLFIIYMSVTFNKAKILQTSQNYQLLLKCMDQIESDYFSNSDVIIYLNTNSNLDNLRISKPTIQTNFNQILTSFGLLIRPNVYIIIAYKNNLEEIFEFLTKTSQWNPRAKFVIVLDENNREIFSTLREIYVFNVIVLTSNDGEVEIFSYFPYGNEEDRTKMVLVDVFNSDGFTKKIDLFPNKMPSKWKNEIIRIGMTPYPPYVISRDCKGLKFCGVEPDVFSLVSQELQFTLEYINNSYTDWGHRGEDGKYINGSSGLQNKEFDVGLGCYFPNSTETWDFDLTYPYLEDTQNWVVPIAKLKAPENSFALAFTINVWLFIAFSFVATSVTVYVVGIRHVEELHTYRNLSRSILVTYQSFLGQAIKRQPKTYPIRIIFLSWVGICYIFVTVIQTKAIVNFHFECYERQVVTIKQAIDSKLKIGFYADSAFQFSDTSDPIDRYIYKNFFSCPRDSSCSARVAHQGDFVTLKLKRHLEFLKSSFYKDADGKPLIYILKYPSRFVPISMAFVKGFPIFEDVNELLYRFKSAGIIANFYNQMNSARDFNANKNSQLRTSHSLGMHTFVFYFYMLFGGWILGFLAFIFENASKMKGLLRFTLKCK